MSTRARAQSTTSPPPTANSQSQPRRAHPPLGMAQFPSDDDSDDEHDRSTIFSSLAGTIRTRARARTNATAPSYDEEYTTEKTDSPIHPLPPTHSSEPSLLTEGLGSQPSLQGRPHVFRPPRRLPDLPDEAHHIDTAYHGGRRNDDQHLAPTPPPHGARRQFSFQRMFRQSSDPSEEERIGLVKEDSKEDPKAAGSPS
jgi:hypothetical protein